ncbi:B-cell scaffold protein with ankyrin repeats isoform X3 [Loxodonta africana]|uniref:B-cell scaffold protein with ankyrin repeats isoform X3 n=1 Tax=Loxodonta africana TaxID=9785 RepID=UPI0030CE4728
MLPAAPGKGGWSRDRPLCGPATPENTKDILMIYEEDAEEWGVYLKEVFLHVVKREAILLYRLENFSLRHLELLSLDSYKCKLLILSNSLLKNLTPKKCQFLEKVLHSPESVVTLLCGVESSDLLYKLLNVSGGMFEISSEQEPEDYISVIKSVLFRGSEDYFEVNVPTDLRGEHSVKISDRKEIEELSEASRSSIPPAMVLPSEISCENPGEIFIILRDGVIGDTVEAEFTSNNKCIRTRPALWNKTVWCMKALDFPPGSVSVNVYCDGVVKTTTEIKYYTTTKEMAFRVADPGHGTCQNDLEEIDDVLTSIFKHEIPHYEFKSLQTEIYPQKEYSHFNELPTLLHCAAKFGLRNLALHLLRCSGAAWASKMKNMEGSDPAHIAERHGHKELKKIFDDFSSLTRATWHLSQILESSTNDEQEHDYEEAVYSPTTENAPFHQESWQVCRLGAEGAEENQTAEEENENESEDRPTEVDSESSDNQYDDLYVFIPGDDPEDKSPEPLLSSRPPLPPPRSVAAALQPDKLHMTLQGTTLQGQMERNKSWYDPGGRHETGYEPKGEEEKEDEKDQEEEEDPYTFAEIDDSEYDTILANMSIKKKLGSRSFIINRPPAPAPRPTNIPPKEETTPYIAQVFQQKTARKQSDSDKFHGPSRKQDRAPMETQAFPTLKDCLAAGQEELILLQERVKTGKMSVDEALEKFKHWQMGKSGLEVIQQEKLRQLRDCIIGNRPEEENVYNKLTIVHHPGGNETSHNENMPYSIPSGNKLSARPQVEKEFGFSSKKDY